MPNNLKMSLLAGAAAIVAVGFTGSTQAQQTISLKFANWLPPVHHWTKTAAEFSKSIEKASGGSIKIAIDKSAVAKPPGQYDLAKNGVRDLIMAVAGYTPGRFPLYRMAEVPFLTPNSETGSEGFHRWYTKNGFDKEEFKGTVLISAFVHGPGLLHSKKEVKTIADLKGMKIRAAGGGALIAKGLSAVPVAIPAPSAHESLQRGTTDAAFFPWEAVHGFKLSKLVKYHVEVPGGLYTTPFMIAMSKKKFDGLPANARRALMTAGGAAGAKFIGKRWDDADKVGKADAIAAGNKIMTLGPDQQKVWAKAIDVVRKNWIQKANEKGKDGPALLKELRAMMGGKSS